MERVNIEWQDQFGRWHHLQQMHHYPNAYRSAVQRSKTMKKRLRLT